MQITTAVFTLYLLTAFAAAWLSAFAVFLLFSDHPEAVNATASGIVTAVFWCLLVRLGLNPNAGWNFFAQPIQDNPGILVSMAIVYSTTYVLLYRLIFFRDLDAPAVQPQVEDEKVAGGFPSEPE